MSRGPARERARPPARRRPRSRAPGGRGGARAGFTLIEVLVALAVMATTLAAIVAVTASSTRAVRTLDQRVALLETARAVEAGIPRRDDLPVSGTLDGDLAGFRWRMEVRPLPQEGAPADAPWQARAITIRVRAPSGAMAALDTVRLVRSQPK